ncbi:shikimate O-hydroxycinnamoyltransferase-like [Carica papaya]|uniref:shikimate O-hydroxycinnamoyltransferase-like n=1 Tax=Carica papaya TaxID=3649 RepID=UPI000B8CF4D1|nr:shikimate O-hydroxycinnamoyltransferase-like [Carica papaya]
MGGLRWTVMGRAYCLLRLKPVASWLIFFLIRLRIQDSAGLFPPLTISTPISSYPLLLTQLTRFKCGSICMGIGMFHTLVDGIAAVRFINSWADIARGLPNPHEPFMDRTVLSPRSPPSPTFHHAEYDPAPTMNAATQTQDFHSLSQVKTNSTIHLKITPDFLATLKAMVNNSETRTKYTSYEALVAHIWRAATKARGLPSDQATRFHVAVNGRARLCPPIPEDYFGNVIFHARPVALAGELQTEPLVSTVERIHSSIKRMDNEYLRSAIDFLALQDNLDALVPMKGNEFYRSPNLAVGNWSRLPTTETDFGWGLPDYVRPASMYSEGKGYILTSPEKDGSLLLAICLETHYIQLFKKLFHDLN